MVQGRRRKHCKGGSIEADGWNPGHGGHRKGTVGIGLRGGLRRMVGTKLGLLVKLFPQFFSFQISTLK